MSRSHPIISITGSSGAGTTSVKKTFENIFRREKVAAAYIEGDAFHRYNRVEMRTKMAEEAERGNKHFSHFSPETNLFEELERVFRDYGESGTGTTRHYVHDDDEAKLYGADPGTFTEWGPVPEGGPPVQVLDLLKRYSTRFMPVLLRNGGHPGIVARKVGGYIDAWNTSEDPGWSIVGFMRYRSRRDRMRLTLDPSFRDGHPDKVAGVLSTFSFPTQRVVSLYASPRVTVALAIALTAALAHLGTLVL